MLFALQDILIKEKSTLRLTFNPRLALTKHISPSTLSNTLTTKMTENHEISVYFLAKGILTLSHTLP